MPPLTILCVGTDRRCVPVADLTTLTQIYRRFIEDYFASA